MLPPEVREIQSLCYLSFKKINPFLYIVVVVMEVCSCDDSKKQKKLKVKHFSSSPLSVSDEGVCVCVWGVII